MFVAREYEVTEEQEDECNYNMQTTEQITWHKYQQTLSKKACGEWNWSIISKVRTETKIITANWDGIGLLITNLHSTHKFRDETDARS